MTEENERLRSLLKEVEGIVVNALASQPHDDDRCREHLEAAVRKLREKLK